MAPLGFSLRFLAAVKELSEGIGVIGDCDCGRAQQDSPLTANS